MSQHYFSNKSIIITGASSGIGRELAIQLAEQGAFLTLGARNTELLGQVAALCNKKGGKAIAVTTDVSIEGQCGDLIHQAIKEYGKIDLLFNNAGIADKSMFEELKDFSTSEAVMRVNFWGSVYCTSFAMPYLKKTKGRIVVINSGAGKFPAPTSIFYGASKHALVGFFDTLRMELQNCGVKVTTIYPDWVATGISSRALGPDGKLMGRIISHENGAIHADACARMVISAVRKDRREVFLAGRQKIGYLLRPIIPNTIDRFCSKFFK